MIFINKTIYHLEMYIPFYKFFYGNKKKVNSTFGFRKRTFINVQNENPKGAFEIRF